MSQSPTQEEAKRAREYIENEALFDFPFVDTASKHNVLAGMVTIIARNAIKDAVPICLIDAVAPGTGKGRLMETIMLITTGKMPAHTTYRRDDDEELRKAITSTLLANPQAIISYDNVMGRVDSAELASSLTQSVRSDRLLGQNRKLELPVFATWFMNGNNLDIGGDIPRRGYLVRMDAKCEKPDQRTGFKHPDLLGWIREHRPALVAALLTICRAWFVAGKPVSAYPVTLGSYEHWAKTVGGILNYAGADQFMANAALLRGDADLERSEWEVFLTAWHERYGSKPIKVAELVRGMGILLKDAVPSVIAGYLGKGSPTLTNSIGLVLRNRRNRQYGNFRLEDSKKDGTNCWAVVQVGTGTTLHF
jgi:hypothetical protein